MLGWEGENVICPVSIWLRPLKTKPKWSFSSCLLVLTHRRLWGSCLPPPPPHKKMGERHRSHGALTPQEGWQRDDWGVCFHFNWQIQSSKLNLILPLEQKQCFPPWNTNFCYPSLKSDSTYTVGLPYRGLIFCISPFLTLSFKSIISNFEVYLFIFSFHSIRGPALVAVESRAPVSQKLNLS